MHILIGKNVAIRLTPCRTVKSVPAGIWTPSEPVSRDRSSKGAPLGQIRLLSLSVIIPYSTTAARGGEVVGTMFKSCDYCRHRKKRCITNPEASRCVDCEHLDLSCEFSYRRPSAKRQLTSRQNAERVRNSLSLSHSSPDDRPRSHDGDGGAAAAAAASAGSPSQYRADMTGDCQLRIAGRGDMSKKHLLQPKRTPLEGQGNPMVIRDVYWQDVYPFFPFIPMDMLEQEVLSAHPLLQCCIEASHRLSPNVMDGTNMGCLKQVNDMVVDRNHLSLPDAAGLLLVTPCLSLDDELVKRVGQSYHGLTSNSCFLINVAFV